MTYEQWMQSASHPQAFADVDAIGSAANSNDGSAATVFITLIDYNAETYHLRLLITAL